MGTKNTHNERYPKEKEATTEGEAKVLLKSQSSREEI